MKKALLLALLTIVSIGCAQEVAPPEKALFSTWSSTESADVLDLSSLKYGTTDLDLDVFGSTCTMRYEVNGDAASGTIDRTYISGPAFCDGLEAAWDYTIEGKIMTLCDTVNYCTQYE